MSFSDCYRQYYQVCTEMQFPDANQAVYYIQEFIATWPRNQTYEYSLNVSSGSAGYSISLIGSKSCITRKREVMKFFLGSINMETYNINGSKLGMADGVCIMENS